MTWLEVPPEAPAVVRHNLDAVNDIVRSVQEGNFSALLGTRLSGKTVLLRYVEQILSGPLRWICVYVDLYAVETSTLTSFFGALMRVIAGRVQVIAGLGLELPEAGTASSAIFRAFLDDVVQGLDRDLVLILEHLEALPTDLVEALLTSLRAAFMDQQNRDQRVIAVVSGALSLAALTVGESSPFRGIARRVFLADLSGARSAAIIAEELAAARVLVSRKARRRLLLAANGDPYLIRRLCQRCIERSLSLWPPRLRAGQVQQVVAEFLRDEVYAYAPLQEAVHVIEDDPDLLRCILLLLAHGTVLRSDLPLPLSPDVDPLHLTGVVEPVGGHSYRVKNLVYERFLERHFHPGRVGHLLATSGRWDLALDYLEAGIRQGSEHSREDMLPATINSMYAAEDVARAAHFLTRGLTAAFGVVEARVWFAQPQETRLRLVAQVGHRPDGQSLLSAEMPVHADRLEARAYRQGRPLRGPEGGRYVWRAMPLLAAGGRSVGVVMLCNDLLDGRVVHQRERELQLAGYLSQAARALQAVGVRRRELALAGSMQASLLPTSPPVLPGWQIAARLQPARETSGDFYDLIPLPGDQLGVVIADVTDKGLGAALYMTLTRTLLRTYAANYPGRPDLTLWAVNERLLADTDSGLFVTLFYGILDPDRGTLAYCNAGHPPPYLVQGAGEETRVEPLPGRGIALGVVSEPGWGHTVLEVPRDGLLLLYTDGVVDALSPDGERFGVAAMLDLLRELAGRPAGEVEERLLGELQQFAGSQPQFDDITVVAVKREG
jgi:serine phosphatase RsbU (regulator of sigma subunit)